MNTLTLFSLTVLGSLILSLLFIPLTKKLAIKVGLMDRPNARKVHASPVPLAGGISIAITTIVALMLTPYFTINLQEDAVWLSGALVILIVGALDDRYNINPVYRLVIQMACAMAVAASGTRINSFYGVLGIELIPVWVQYGLTVIVIAGVMNAYNLMDGIDGLIGGLSLVAASVLGVIAYQFNQMELTILCLIIIGAVIGFLKHNLSKSKIFMGDAGSLFLGFVMVVVAIKLLNATNQQNPAEGLKVLLFVGGIFFVPVLDSLRVYRARIKRGISPFKADRTHLHHLFLYLGITHKRATVLIVVLITLIIGVIAGLVYLIPVTWVIIAGITVFVVVTTFLTLNHSVMEWKEKLKKLEKN